jgi:hypothetical protein
MRKAGVTATHVLGRLLLGECLGHARLRRRRRSAKQELEDCIATIREGPEQQEILQTGTELRARDLDAFSEALVAFTNS